jgi:hypothetical protein
MTKSQKLLTLVAVAFMLATSAVYLVFSGQ